MIDITTLYDDFDATLSPDLSTTNKILIAASRDMLVQFLISSFFALGVIALFISFNIQSPQDSLGAPLLQALLDRVGRLKDLGQLLEGAVLGLGEEEVDDADLDEVPKDEYEVKVVADAFKGRAAGVLEHRAGGAAGKVAHGRALGARGRGQRLGNVHALQRGPAKREDDAKDEDEGHRGVGGGRLARVVGREFGRARDNGKADGTENGGVNQQRSVRGLAINNKDFPFMIHEILLDVPSSHNISHAST